ncbi:aarF domain-containing protein kinase 1-like isoform X2 [Gigantopelta aegis]|uniref:aarF domain-containing protein kinase 1-like isoform X2 n=1 Tax=Gigantopelta aegis TaxID=1735272 RepID=UPI001B88E33D|nr:aarF domain-containing protein kinase 1-like isoform X2 [Gigantopelta aegis]
MRSRKLLLKLFRIGVIGSSVAGAVFLLQQNDWNPSSIGAVRFGRAAYAAVRVAVDYKLTKRMLDPNDPSYQKETSNLHLRSALRLRDMCCANGGAFIKVGQHIGSLEYLLPMEYVNTMKVLLDKAPESKLEDLYRVIEEDLGLKFLVHTMAWFFPDFQYIWLAEETKKNLPKELDFIQEGHNCERVSRMFKKFDFLKIPKIYWNLTSERVLTMEFCEGGRVDNLEYMREHHISVSEVTKNLGKLYSEMIFVQGYVHCDPHPGNVFVNKTPQGTQVILLDHGLYQMLTDDFRMNYSKLWISLINADVDGIKKYAEAMNCGNLHGLFACMLTARSWKAVSAGIDKHEFSEAEGQEIKENAANYFIEITDILNRVPRQMLLILKTNDVLRGIESSLKTRANATSFINMSRCCVRALAQEELKRCRTLYCKLRVWTSQHSQLFKISLYEFYMWCVSTPLVLYFTHRKKQLYS